MTIIKNYTTSISAAQTAGEVQALLAEHGATRIAIDYAGGHPSGIVFQVPTPTGLQLFQLPVDTQAMHKTLIREFNAGRLPGISTTKAMSRDHAERVAWRVIKDWVAAQMTIVATQMANLDQVMLPYLVVPGERTLYAAYRDQQLAAITAREDR